MNLKIGDSEIGKFTNHDNEIMFYAIIDSGYLDYEKQIHLLMIKIDNDYYEKITKRQLFHAYHRFGGNFFSFTKTHNVE